jgi:hypothetical protein
MVNLTPRPHYPRGKRFTYLLNRMIGSQSRSDRGKTKTLLLLPGIKPTLLGCPARSLFIPSTLYRITILVHYTYTHYYYYYYYYYYPRYLFYAEYLHFPETNHVPMEHCCSYSDVTIYGASITRSCVDSIVSLR